MPGVRIRIRESDDYIAARGANPRTGLISPSVVTLLSPPTPLTPGEALSLRYPDLGCCRPPDRPKLSRNGAQQALRRGDKDNQENTKILQQRSVDLFDLEELRGTRPIWEEYSRAPNKHPDSVSRITEDRFIVHMPSAREPQPYTFPGHSSAQIAAYQHYAEKTRKISGASSQQSTLPSITSLSQDQGFRVAEDCSAKRKMSLEGAKEKPMPGTLRIGTPPSSPPHRSSPTFDAFPVAKIATGPSCAPAPVPPDISIPRKPIASSSTRVPTLHHTEWSAPSETRSCLIQQRYQHRHSPSPPVSQASRYTCVPSAIPEPPAALLPSPQPSSSSHPYSTPPFTTTPPSRRRPSHTDEQVAFSRPLFPVDTPPYPTSPNRSGIAHQFHNAVSDLRRLPKIHLVHPGMAGVPAELRYRGGGIRTEGGRIGGEEDQEDQEDDGEEGRSVNLEKEVSHMSGGMYTGASPTENSISFRPLLSTLQAFFDNVHILATSILPPLQTPLPQPTDTTRFTSTAPLKCLLINTAYAVLCIYVAVCAWHIFLGLKYVFDTILLPLGLVVGMMRWILG